MAGIDMSQGRLIVLSPGMKRISTLGGLLYGHELVFGIPRDIRANDRVVAWGMRPSAQKARAFAQKHGLSIVYVEDGLVRSVGLGSSGPPYSLMVDDLALYLDASRPTRLEQYIGTDLSGAQMARAQALIQMCRDHRVSKYNHQRDIAIPVQSPYVLVVDQTRGDASISAGMASGESFQRMLRAALKENPDTQVVLKVHPDVLAGRKQGNYDLVQIAQLNRVTVAATDAHPISLVQNAERVYVVTSQLGFEALLWGKPVRTFGLSFYASWGLTEDDLPRIERRGEVSLAQLVHAVMVQYARYVDPESGLPCEPETLIAWMGLQRRMRERFAPKLVALSFSKWKRPFVRDFFNGSDIRFTTRVKKDNGHPLAVWGRKHDDLIIRKAGQLPRELIRLEDGFLRSVGLGADLIRPLSWVQDPVGIYYDASAPSQLELLLRTTQFDVELIVRARAIRERILNAGLTKYNVGGGSDWQRNRTDRPVLLVPGQVESDASIRYGAMNIRRNIDLLKAVRSENPDAFILYKPHPDVCAKLRDAGEGESDAPQWCDEVVTDVSMTALLEQIDEVHTLTSLTGFEALLRGKKVVTYGQPFYAGWGLTQDRALSAEVRLRRDRILTLDELVAASLVLYPTYVSRITHRFTTCERALDELIAWRGEKSRLSLVRRWIAILTRKI